MGEERGEGRKMREWHSLIGGGALPPVGKENWVEVAVEDTSGEASERFVMNAFLSPVHTDPIWYEYTRISACAAVTAKNLRVIAWRERPAPTLPYTDEWE